jgi:cytochrome oxidase Cu insertion factor (SCO1/SenC/PrrC family)
VCYGQLAVAGPVPETYLVGPRDTNDTAAWRTEIGLSGLSLVRMRWRRTALGPSRAGSPGKTAEAPGAAPGPRACGQRAPGGGLLRTAVLAAAVTVVLVVAVAGSAYLILRPGRSPASGQALRPSGIPSGISAHLANLMSLSPVPATRAPGFTLTDQQGRTLPLAAFRGKVVVLQFVDPHCTDICPIVSAEYLRAYRDLGPLAGKVVFAAVNVNQYHAKVQDMAAYSREQQLTAIPNWHLFTGPARALRAVWRDYSIAVEAPNPDADIVHTSAVYFLDPQGRERYLAAPMVNHTKSGKAYLPPAQIAAWGHGIALLARHLAS